MTRPANARLDVDVFHKRDQWWLLTKRRIVFTEPDNMTTSFNSYPIFHLFRTRICDISFYHIPISDLPLKIKEHASCLSLIYSVLSPSELFKLLPFLWRFQAPTAQGHQCSPLWCLCGRAPATGIAWNSME